MSSFADEFSELATISFVSHDGDVQPSGFTKRDIQRSGVVGKASMITGYIGSPFQITTRAVASSSANAALLQILYSQYKAHLITFTDDKGNAWSHISVEDVADIRVTRFTGGVGLAAANSYLIQATWTLQSVATAY